jgi:hypothetical protein
MYAVAERTVLRQHQLLPAVSDEHGEGGWVVGGSSEIQSISAQLYFTLLKLSLLCVPAFVTVKVRVCCVHNFRYVSSIQYLLYTLSSSSSSPAAAAHPIRRGARRGASFRRQASFGTRHCGTCTGPAAAGTGRGG